MIKCSLRSRRLEVVGERENGGARGRHACLLLLARAFFLVPTTFKRLLRRLEQYSQLYRQLHNTDILPPRACKGIRTLECGNFLLVESVIQEI